ncbi:MAG: hypothetical protein MZV64_44160 [Ignavibacteriales bacterium]|nr:hypothetical protein [Ignavibacteriales bacterium]
MKTDLSIDKINLNADQAVYLGLLVNELVSNSLKHAFKSTLHDSAVDGQKRYSLAFKKILIMVIQLKSVIMAAAFPRILILRIPNL